MAPDNRTALSVLVVGSGVSGLAAASFLQRSGHQTLVVEKRPGLPRDGLALNLPGNAVRCLTALGREDIVHAGAPVRRREYRAREGRLLFAVDEDETWRGVATSIALRHDRLIEMLARDLDVRFECALTALSSDPRPVAQLSDGTSEAFDLVVGADGVGSWVRGTMGEATRVPSAMTASAWRFVTRNPGVRSWTAWTGGGLVLLAIPLPGDELYVYLARTRGGHVGTTMDWVESVLPDFSGAPRELAALLADPGTRRHRGPVDEVDCERWGSGGVAIIGDAAHATGPVWAQGAGMGLEDGWVLAQELDAGPGVEEALRRWEDRRRPRVRHVREVTDRMSRLARVPALVQRITLPLMGPRGFRDAYVPLRPTP